jgi:hypothetical protein
MVKRLTFLVLLLSATRSGAHNEIVPHLNEPAKADRIVKVNFFVDNKTLLEKPYLEVSVMDQGFSRRTVALENGLSGSVGTGVSEMSVPDGAVQLAVCGLVKCSDNGETELVCGKTSIPSSIDLFYQHEVTFSTSWACQQTSAVLASR